MSAPLPLATVQELGLAPAGPLPPPTTWLGATPVDRRRTLGLLLCVALLSPLIGLAELFRKLGVPLTDACAARRPSS